MKRTILSIEKTYLENDDVIGFFQGGALVLIDDKESLSKKCYNDTNWAEDNDISPITASILYDTDQKKEEFVRWSRDNQSAIVEAYYLRHNDSVTVIRYKLEK